MSSVWSNISTWFQEKAGELTLYRTLEAASQGPIPTPVTSTPSQPDSSEFGDDDLSDSSEDEALFAPSPQAQDDIDTDEEMFQRYLQLTEAPVPRRRGRVKFQDHRKSSSAPIMLQPRSDSPFAEAPSPVQTQGNQPPDLAAYLVNKGHPLHVNYKQTADGAPAFENPADNNSPSLCREQPVAEQEYPGSTRRVMYDETPDEQAFLRGSAKPDQDHRGVAFHCLPSPGANPVTETSQAANAGDYSHPQKQPLRSSAFEPVGPSPGYPPQPDEPPPNLKPLSLDDYLVQRHSMEDQPLPHAERPRMLGPQPVSPYYTSHGLSPADLPSQPHRETQTTSHREPRHQAQIAPSFGMDSLPPQPHGGAWSTPAEPSGFPARNPGHLGTVAPPAQARRDVPFLSPMDSRGGLARPPTPIPTSQEVYLKKASSASTP